MIRGRERDAVARGGTTEGRFVGMADHSCKGRERISVP
jgi:hypothetical protein